MSSLEVYAKMREPAANSATASCSLCSARPEFMYGWERFKLYRCVGCGIESVDPMPTEAEVEAFYQQVFYQHYSRALPERWQLRLQLVERAFERYICMWSQASGKRRPQRFLDIGGGLG